MTVHHNTRNNDYATSIEGAEKVTERAPNQRKYLLAAYWYADEKGLTDEEAAENSGLLDCCYWKRCGELRADGYIEFTDRVRPGAAGTNRKVSVITVRGRYAHQAGERI